MTDVDRRILCDVRGSLDRSNGIRNVQPGTGTAFVHLDRQAAREIPGESDHRRSMIAQVSRS